MSRFFHLEKTVFSKYFHLYKSKIVPGIQKSYLENHPMSLCRRSTILLKNERLQHLEMLFSWCLGHGKLKVTFAWDLCRWWVSRAKRENFQFTPERKRNPYWKFEDLVGIHEHIWEKTKGIFTINISNLPRQDSIFSIYPWLMFRISIYLDKIRYFQFTRD